MVVELDDKVEYILDDYAVEQIKAGKRVPSTIWIWRTLKNVTP